MQVLIRLHDCVDLEIVQNPNSKVARHHRVQLAQIPLALVARVLDEARLELHVPGVNRVRALRHIRPIRVELAHQVRRGWVEQRAAILVRRPRPARRAQNAGQDDFSRRRFHFDYSKSILWAGEVSSMATRTVEDYLKTLYARQLPAGEKLVAMGELASAMNVAAGTATAMVKTLAESGLVDYEPRGGVRLSSKGEKLALHVLRRHRLVELFLVKVLGLDWSEVDEEAEELEHAISDKVLAKIDALLKHPQVDPHGDPIPTSAGKLPRRSLQSLADAELGAKVRVARVIDQNPQFLQFVDRHNLRPGTEVVVKSRDDIAGAVAVHPKNQPAVTLGTSAAAK